MKVLFLGLFMSQVALGAVCNSTSGKVKIEFLDKEELIFIQLKQASSTELLVGKAITDTSGQGQIYQAFNQDGDQKEVGYYEHWSYPHCRLRVCPSQPTHLVKTLKIEDEYFNCL